LWEDLLILRIEVKMIFLTAAREIDDEPEIGPPIPTVAPHSDDTDDEIGPKPPEPSDDSASAGPSTTAASDDEEEEEVVLTIAFH